MRGAVSTRVELASVWSIALRGSLPGLAGGHRPVDTERTHATPNRRMWVVPWLDQSDAARDLGGAARQRRDVGGCLMAIEGARRSAARTADRPGTSTRATGGHPSTGAVLSREEFTAL